MNFEFKYPVGGGGEVVIKLGDFNEVATAEKLVKTLIEFIEARSRVAMGGTNP